MVLTSINHFSHQHSLIKGGNGASFKCDGCEEQGCGIRYRCEDCNFDLHEECALYSSELSHAFYKNCTFKFLKRAPGNRYCNTCGGDVKGFVYHCQDTGHDLHPCCANLPHVLRDQGVVLYLQERLASKCCQCGSTKLWGKVKGWSYMSKDSVYHFHISCVKNMAMRKQENGCVADSEMNNMDMGIVESPALGLVRRGGGESSKVKVCYQIARVLLKLIVSIITGNPFGLFV